MAVKSITRYSDLIDMNLSSGYKKGDIETVNLMTQNNELLNDAELVMCNMGDSHRVEIMTGLPESYWTKYYEGIQPSTGTMAIVNEGTAMLQASSQIDVQLLNVSNNPKKDRTNKAEGHLESMAQNVCRHIFYGNSDKDSSQFGGLSSRFNSLNGSANSSQVIDAGGTGNDNTSIWFVTWSPTKTSIIYPGSTTVGISREDKGEQRVSDNNGRGYFVEEDRFTWNGGLCVSDYRYVSRVCNIDVNQLIAGNVKLYNFLSDAFYAHRGSEVMSGRTYVYCNRTVRQALDRLARNAGASDNFVRLEPDQLQGKLIKTYQGYPVRSTEAILNTEERVK